MWMQKSVEGSSFSSSGNFHDRNRFGAPYAQGGNSYGGGAAASAGAGDWKSKILESGQWLGGKVIEYGGKLARGPNSDAIPDQYAQQMPRNDGRANWMADIRSSSSSYSGGGNAPSSYSGGGYQNDFATERPKAYSEYSGGYGGGSGPKPFGGYEPKSVSSSDRHHRGKSRHAKKKIEAKKSRKSRKSKKKQSESEIESESESESESEEELSISESSETESPDDRRHKGKAKKKSKTKKHSGFYSEESDSDEGDEKKAKDYAYSFDPAKLPPAEEKASKKAKAKKSKKDKARKKSRRQSVASTDDESASDKENVRKAKKRGSKKAAAAASSASVDLLGVDLEVHPAAPPAAAPQQPEPSIFDAPQSLNPLQDLAGLSFAAPVQTPAPTQPSIFDGSAPAAVSSEAESQQAGETFRTNLLPENNLVDFNSLVSEKKKSLSANPEEKRTLNDLQKARGADQPTPVMAMPMQGQPNMLQLNMSQLQITEGAPGMQQQMYPQMQQMPMQMMLQPQMGMMAQPQMNMQMMQQFPQGGAPAQQGLVAGNPKSADPFHQLP